MISQHTRRIHEVIMRPMIDRGEVGGMYYPHIYSLEYRARGAPRKCLTCGEPFSDFIACNCS